MILSISLSFTKYIFGKQILIGIKDGGDQSDFDYIVRELIYFSNWLPSFCNMKIDDKCELRVWLASEGRIELAAETRFACIHAFMYIMPRPQFSGSRWKLTLYID